jgi:hypothetical protein
MHSKGCLLSPIRFNIYGDDLLHELHHAGQLHGMNSANCQDKLGGQAYLTCDMQDLLHMKACNTCLQFYNLCLVEDLLLQPALRKC